MRITRYLWINNLPPRATEEDLINELQSNGKIQNVRIHNGPTTRTAVVAFVDTKSATKTIESGLILHKVNLNIQYCESSGLSGSNQDMQDNKFVDDFKSRGCNKANRSFSHNRSRSSSNESDESHSDFVKKKPDKHGDVLKGIAVSNLPRRSTSTNLREGLFHEFKKYGKITSVIIEGQGSSRCALITFKRTEDADKAYEYSQDKVFFRTPIKVEKAAGADAEDPDLCPPEHVMDEYHPKATKTLFVGNLCSSTITKEELHSIFIKYGEIIEIDIKNQANQLGTSYAFVQYTDIKSVVVALKDQELIRVNSKPVKLGFGKSQPTNVVWLDNLASGVTDAFLKRQFSRYGRMNFVIMDEKLYRALLYFENPDIAQRAVNETRNRSLMNRKVQIDYASQECQAAFMRRVAQQNSFGKVSTYEKLQELIGCMRFASGFHSVDEKRRHGENAMREDLSSPDGSGYNYRTERKRRISRDRCDLTPISLSDDSACSDGSYSVVRGSSANYKHSADKKKHSRKHDDFVDYNYRKSESRRHANSPVAYSTRKVNHYSTQSNGLSLNLPKSYSTWRTGRRGRSRTRCDSSASISPRPNSDVRVVHNKRSPKNYHAEETSDVEYDESRFYRNGQGNSRYFKGTKYGDTSPASRSTSRPNRNDEIHSRSTTPIGSNCGYETSVNNFAGNQRHSKSNTTSRDQNLNRKSDYCTDLHRDRNKLDRSSLDMSPHSKYSVRSRERNCSGSRDFEVDHSRLKSGANAPVNVSNVNPNNNATPFVSANNTKEEISTSGKSASELSKLNRERLALLRELSMLDAENEVPVTHVLNTSSSNIPKSNNRNMHDRKVENVKNSGKGDFGELHNQREMPVPGDQFLKQPNPCAPNIDQSAQSVNNSHVLGGTSSSSEPGDLLLSPINNVIQPPESASSPISSVSSSACAINKSNCSSHYPHVPSSPLNETNHESSFGLQSKMNHSIMSVPFSNTSSTVSSLSSSRDPRLSHHNGSSLLSSPASSMHVNSREANPFNLNSDKKAPSGFNSMNYSMSSVLSGLHRSSGLLSSTMDNVEAEPSSQSVLDPVDERIRQLDMELMKSEKVRPVVDYSKFRIRRKTDVPASTTAVSACTSNPLMSSSVSTNVRENPLSPLNSGLAPKTSPISISTRVPESLVSPPHNARTTDTSDFIKSMLSVSKSNQTALTPSGPHSGPTYAQWSSVHKPENTVLTASTKISSPVLVHEKEPNNNKNILKSVSELKSDMLIDTNQSAKLARDDAGPKLMKSILKKETLLCDMPKKDDVKADILPNSPKKSPKQVYPRSLPISPSRDVTKVEGQQKRLHPAAENSAVIKSKVQKLDIPKPALDDSIFQASVVKKVKKAKIEKSKISEQTSNVKQRKICDGTVSVKLPWEPKKEKKSSISSEKSKSVIKSKKLVTDTLNKEINKSKKHDPSLLGSVKNDKVSQMKKVREESKKFSRKKRVMKKQFSSSEETHSDDSDDLNKLREHELNGPYESMYDKIKRRTHKDNPVKDEDIHKKNRLLIQNKRRKISHMSTDNSSSSGSDTDQCQSDTPIEPKSIPTSKKSQHSEIKLSASERQKLLQQLSMSTSSSDDSSDNDSPPPLFKNKLKDTKMVKLSEYNKAKKINKDRIEKVNGQSKAKKQESIRRPTKASKLKEKLLCTQKKNFASIKKKFVSNDCLPQKKKSLTAPLVFSSSSESEELEPVKKNESIKSKSNDSNLDTFNGKKETSMILTENQDLSSDSSHPRISRSCTPESDINDPFYLDYKDSPINDTIELKPEIEIQETVIESHEINELDDIKIDTQKACVDTNEENYPNDQIEEQVIPREDAVGDVKPTVVSSPVCTQAFQTPPSVIHSQNPTLLTGVPAGSLATIVQQPNASQTVLITGQTLPIVSGLVTATPTPQSSLLTQPLSEDLNKSNQQRIALLMTTPAQPTNGLSTLANAASVVSSSSFVKAPTIVLSATQMPVATSSSVLSNKIEMHQPIVSVATSTPVLTYTAGKCVPSVIIGTSPVTPTVESQPSAATNTVVATSLNDVPVATTNKVVVSQSPDYTSYVRNVIARVTHEKDVELTMMARNDKHRRMKKNFPIAPNPAPGVNTPPTSTFLCIPASIPGVNACNKPAPLDNKTTCVTNKVKRTGDNSSLSIPAKSSDSSVTTDPYEPNFDEESTVANNSTLPIYPARSRHLSSTTSEISTGQEENCQSQRTGEIDDLSDNMGVQANTNFSSSNSTPQPISGGGSSCSQRASPERQLPKSEMNLDNIETKEIAQTHANISKATTVTPAVVSVTNSAPTVDIQNTSNLEQLVHLANPLAYIYTLLAQQQQQQSIVAPGNSPQLKTSTPNIPTTNSSDYLASMAAICSMNQSTPASVPQRPGSVPTESSPSGVPNKTSTSSNPVPITPVTPMSLVSINSSTMPTVQPNQSAQISPTFSNTAFDLQTPNRPPTAPAAIMHLVNEKIVGSEYMPIWRGRLSLKNEEVHAQMFHLSGNIELFKVCMAVLGDSNSQLLKIAQRMRFEPTQLEGVNRKLRQQSDFTMCLGLAAPPASTVMREFDQQHALMNRIMSDSFIKYLQEKSAAGIINVYHPATQENLYVIHIFPPCEFAHAQLQVTTPSLYQRLTENTIPHLLVVITTV